MRCRCCRHYCKNNNNIKNNHSHYRNNSRTYISCSAVPASALRFSDSSCGNNNNCTSSSDIGKTGVTTITRTFRTSDCSHSSFPVLGSSLASSLTSIVQKQSRFRQHYPVHNVQRQQRQQQRTTTTIDSCSTTEKHYDDDNFTIQEQQSPQNDQRMNPHEKKKRRNTIILSSNHRTNLIFGANTGVGKTIVSAGLVRASAQRAAVLIASGIRSSRDSVEDNRQYQEVHYIKPIQCGGGGGSGAGNSGGGLNSSTNDVIEGIFGVDVDFVKYYGSRLDIDTITATTTTTTKSTVSSCSTSASNDVNNDIVGDRMGNHSAINLRFHNLLYLDKFSSPHVAAAATAGTTAATQKENLLLLSDRSILDSLYECLDNIQQQQHQQQQQQNAATISTVTYIETAGGVLSPSTSSPYNREHYHSKMIVVENNSNKSNNNKTNNAKDEENDVWGWITQGDLYRTMSSSVPVILVGDGRLGGISCTISALESLVLRGYDVVGIVIIETEESITGGYDNVNAIRSYLSNTVNPVRTGSGQRILNSPYEQRIAIVALPPLPSDCTVPLQDWYDRSDVQTTFSAFNDYLQQYWEGYCNDLKSTFQRSMMTTSSSFSPSIEKPNKILNNNSNDKILVGWIDNVIDHNTVQLMKMHVFSKQDNTDPDYDYDNKRKEVNSSSDSSSSTLRTGTAGAIETSTTKATTIVQQETVFDATSSLIKNTDQYGAGWGTINLTLARASANARYGGGNSWSDDSQPSPPLGILRDLLVGVHGPGYGWAKQVLVTQQSNSSDVLDGAIQLGIQTYQRRRKRKHDYDDDEVIQWDWVLCGQDPIRSSTEFITDDGLFLEPPTIGYKDGKVKIFFHDGFDPPPHINDEFDSIGDVLDLKERKRNNPKLKSLYKEMIALQYLVYENSGYHKKIASIVIEPILYTDTMSFIDPVWQQALIEIGRERNVPIVFDESYTGLYRFNVPSAGCTFVQKDPDIAIYGGMNNNNSIYQSTLSSQSTVTSVCAMLTCQDVYERYLNAILEQENVVDKDKHGNSASHNSDDNDENKSKLDNDDDAHDKDNDNALQTLLKRLFLQTPSPSDCVSAMHTIEAYNKAAHTKLSSPILSKSNNNDHYNNMSMDVSSLLLFNEEHVKALSCLQHVDRCFTLGSVLVVHFATSHDETNESTTKATTRTKSTMETASIDNDVDNNSINGKTSTIISNVLSRLRNHHGIIARSPQRDDTVLYFTVSPLSSKEQCDTILVALHETMDWINTNTTSPTLIEPVV